MSVIEEAIILAAGRGRRLGASSNGLPKCLVDVGGRTILDRQLSAFWSAGVRRFVLVTGYRHDLVEQAASAVLPDAHFRFVRNSDYARTNVLVSWLLGSGDLSSDHFYAHADTVFDPALVRRLVSCGEGPVNLACDTVPCGEEEMKVRLESGQVVEISKTVRHDLAAGEFTGVMTLRGGIVERLRTIAVELVDREGGDQQFFEAVLQTLIDRGEADLLRVVEVTGVPWREIDTPEDLAAARALFAGPEARPSRGAVSPARADE